MKKKQFYPPERMRYLTTKLLLCMKLTVFLILVSIFAVTASSYSQQSRFDLKYENTTIREVLNVIKSQSDLQFFYSNDDFDVNKRVDLRVKNASIEEVLDQLLGSMDVDYKIIDKAVIISKSDMKWSFDKTQQSKVVSGKVTDSSGTPLPGVTILVKGTTQGTVTDANGNYFLKDISGEGTLVFSFVGMKTQEIPVDRRMSIDVIMLEEAIGLDEVVAVGYGTQKKANLTGAVDQIDSESIQNIAVPNITRALQGIIPNLNISFSNGRPTTNPEYNIRGLTSIGAGGEALILIDGVVGNPLTLNPDDIESVTVLKDAASAAIYGARGAFGVVLFTTKKPDKTRKPQITYSTSYSLNRRTTKRDIVTDSYLWAKMYNETYSAWYDYTRTPTSIGSSGLSFSSDYLEALKYRSEHPEENLPEVEINPANGEYVYYGNTDWYNLLYTNNIPSMEHSLTASGSGEKIDYSISGRYFSQDGLYKIRSDQYDKYNLRFKGGIQITDWLKINSNVDFSSYKYSDPFSGSSIWASMNTSGMSTPMAVMFNPDGTLTRTAANGVGILYSKRGSKLKQNQLQQTIDFELSLIKNTLNVKGDFTYKNSVYETETKTVPISYSVKPDVTGTTGTSSLANTKQITDYYASNLYGDFTRSFGHHNLKVLVGGNLELNKLKNLSVSRSGLILDDLSDFNLTTGDVFSITGGGSEWSILGLFSRINYDFKQKYLLEINGRYDGSSKFPKGEHFGFFPSFSAGWRISEENFMANTDNWLDNLKIRASYGSLGNSQINPYLYIEQIKASKSSRIIEGGLPIYISNPEVLADNFTWETSTTFDAGFDINMLQNRLGVTFDWYKRTTTDMITEGPVLPAVFGADSPTGNYADLETKGFELSLTWNDQIKTGSKLLNYSIRFTLADHRSYITKYNNPTGLLSVDNYTFEADYYVGMHYGDIWGYVTEGLFESEEDVATHADQSYIQSSSLRIALPGDIKFKDLNNDEKIDKGNKTLTDHGDWKIIGNRTPRYSFGVSMNADWNNFSVSAFFQGIGKRDWYPPYGFTEFWGQYTVWYANIPKHTLENAYTLDHPDPNAYWPRYKAPSPYGERGLQAQTRYLQDASYVRLKDLTVAYSLPKRIIEKIKLSNLKFFFSGQNLWTYTPIHKITKDIDPEAIENTGNEYPMLKSYTFGMSMTF